MSDIIVYGRGKTGRSLAKLVERDGDVPILFQDGDQLVSEDFFRGKKVLLSPGVAPDADGVRLAERAGARIESELSFCFPRCKGRVISVTGTNGKTTVCQMIDLILSRAGKAHRLLGNGGVPLSQEVDEVSANETVVLESSSFQLRNAVGFAPYISVFTNVAPDHLTYHGSYASYVRSKCNNFLWQHAEQFAIFNADDEKLFAFAEHCKSQAVFFSTTNKNANLYIDEQGKVVWNFGGKVRRVEASFPSEYPHNKSNFLAAVAACVSCGVDLVVAVQALAVFEFARHRTEFVCALDGITYVDDSKGTNVAATLCAVRSFSCPTALIVGGSDKGEDFSELFSLLPSSVVYVAAVGRTAERMKRQAEDCGKNVCVFDNYPDAVRACKAAVKASGQGVVLLSNACASFDMFDNFEQRGDYFCDVARKVANEPN